MCGPEFGGWKHGNIELKGVKNRLASNKDRILKILSGVENLFPHRILTKVSFHIWADVQACQHFAF